MYSTQFTILYKTCQLSRLYTWQVTRPHLVVISISSYWIMKPLDQTSKRHIEAYIHVQTMYKNRDVKRHACKREIRILIVLSATREHR